MQIKQSIIKKTGLEYSSELYGQLKVHKPELKIKQIESKLSLEKPAKNYLEILQRLEKEKKIADVNALKIELNLPPAFKETLDGPMSIDESARRIMRMDPLISRAANEHRKRLFS
jgi:hypothetical protein